jgi:hypothetical protein
LISLPLYFFSPANHFNRTMTRRSPWIFVTALTGLLAVQSPLRADATDHALVKSAVLESNVAYLQVGQVGKELADEIRAAQTALTVSNKIAGTVLDLRFAGGDDLDSAKASADLFASGKLPMAILVNGQTSGAAAALALDLRAARVGLIFGTAETKDEATALATPDIVVAARPEDQRALMENPYGTPAQIGSDAPDATTNLLPFVDHTTEADLVHAKIKDGDEDENFPPAQKAAPPKPFIRDPVLARAVDLIKGLAVVRAARS